MITGHLPELVIILVLGLVFFGPKRLPELGEAMGKGIHSFKKGIANLEDESGPRDASDTTNTVSTLPPTSPVFIVDDVAETEPAEKIQATHVR